MNEHGERIRDSHERVRDLLERGDAGALREYLGELHASDLADLIEALGDAERMQLVRRLPVPLVSEALAEMEDVGHPADILSRLEPARAAEIVGELADDDAADLIGDLEPVERARILAALEDARGTEDARGIEELLHYPEDTAGGIMTRDLVAVSSGLTAGAAIEAIRGQAHDADHFYTIFVVDAGRRLRGVLSLQRLVLADPDAPIAGLVEDPPATVPVTMDQEEVGRILSRYNMVSIGVVDPRGRLLGRITFDDVIDVLESETTEDILRFAAVSEEEEVRGTTGDAVRSRLPWLLVNLLTAALAASVVYLFQSTIERLVLLAVVMPIIAGMGGNAGTQALAVTIRRIAVADESLAARWHVVGKEALVGLINGLVLGLVAAVAGHLIAGAPLFGLVVLLAMWGNLVVASFAGAFIPIFLESVGVDPAVASSVFVTTLTDLCGFFLLLGLAAAMLT